MPCHIEFIGLPGSGKSQLSRQLIQSLRRESIPALAFHDALRSALARSARQDRGGWRAQFKRILFSRPVQDCWPSFLYFREQVQAFGEFWLERPELFEQLGRLLHTSLSHPEDRERLLRFFFDEFSGFYLLQKFLQDAETIVWHEGFCQRAMSIWGRLPCADLPRQIQAYIAAIPRPQHVFHLATSPRICIERMKIRGFAPFVGHQDPRRVEEKMEWLGEVVQCMCDALVQQGVAVHVLRNEGDLADSADQMKAAARSISGLRSD